MKTISLDKIDHKVADTLAGQSHEEPILLTQGDAALGLLLKLPNGMKEAQVDEVCWLDQAAGSLVGIVQLKHGDEGRAAHGTGQPVFGRCRGMLTIAQEDDEHLKDFVEYM